MDEDGNDAHAAKWKTQFHRSAKLSALSSDAARSKESEGGSTTRMQIAFSDAGIPEGAPAILATSSSNSSGSTNKSHSLWASFYFTCEYWG